MQMTFFLGALIGTAFGIAAARVLIWPHHSRRATPPAPPSPAPPALDVRPVTRLTNRKKEK